MSNVERETMLPAPPLGYIARNKREIRYDDFLFGWLEKNPVRSPNICFREIVERDEYIMLVEITISRTY